MKRILSIILCIVSVVALALPAHAASSSVYVDEESGNSFVLPAGWDGEETGESFVKLKITDGSDSAPLMQYGSADLWIELSSAKKNKISRSDYDNSMFSESEIAEILEVESGKVKMTKLNGYEYFRAEVENTTKVDSFSFTLTSTIWIRIENGWFYIHLFSGDSDHKLYSKFEDMVASSTFGNEEAEETDSDYLDGSWSDKKFNRSGRSSYPFVLDKPLKKCKGFTVDYLVSDVTKGKMKSDSKFQIFYRLSDGTWKKGKEFTLDDDGFASVKQTLSKAGTVTQVAVHCMNAGHFNYQYSMGIKNPIY